ncbi:MAG: membrane dipeptidase [Bacteroidales bacterium]|nr:membrane dipeptidase [Bacteroidales bacterium]
MMSGQTEQPLQAARPCIGIVCNSDENTYMVARAYVRAVEAAGAVPLLIAPCAEDCFAEVLQRLDGVLFTGGGDFTPELFGMPQVPTLGTVNTPRDVFEKAFFKAVMDWQLPVLGICRGMQLMNLCLGGSIYQDLATEYRPDVLAHSQQEPRSQATHAVCVMPDTLLARLLGSSDAAVNSFHHQAVHAVADDLQVSAMSSDGVVEAVESSTGYPMLGVQWHPEALVGHADAGTMHRLFEWLRDEALLCRRARRLHRRAVSVDTHCDTPMYMAQSYYPPEEFLSPSRVTPEQMRRGGVDGVVMAVYLKQGECSEAGYAAAVAQTDDILQRIDRYAAANGLALVRTPAEFMSARMNGRLAVFKAIENGYAIGTDLGNVARWAAQGIVYMTLCHNGHNAICDSASAASVPLHGGLSAFGRQVVAELNRHGVLVDVSHAAESTFYDAVEASSEPIFASHSSARALCDHGRNLTDEQLRLLAARGGMINICLYGGFLRRDGRATIRDAVRHINHVRNLIGVEHVGIGSDFDGGGGIAGCMSSQDYFRFYPLLLAEGYTEDEIVQVTGGNFLRLLQRVQSAARV